jgi:hypothetical protein
MPNSRVTGRGRPSEEARQRAAADRYANADESAPNYPGFHSYAASPEPPADSGVDDRWPDNWPDQRGDGASAEDDEAIQEGGQLPRDYLRPLLWTGFWLLLPLLLLLGRALLRSGQPVAGCAAGMVGCASPRVEALGNLIAASPRWLLAIAAALAVATVLRWASDAWRAVTIGFCSAVVAGGTITILTGM